MERFKRTTAHRYKPIAHLQTTLECDAAVHTATPHHSLASLLAPLTSTTLSHNSTTPPLWPDILSHLAASLQSPRNPQTLIASYTDALESLTTISSHDHLCVPLATFLCMWVCEPALKDSLRTLGNREEKNFPQGTAALASPLPKGKPHVLLVCREGSRQDDAVRVRAVEEASKECGEDFVHVVKLGAEEGEETPGAVAAMIDRMVDEALKRAILDVGKEADRLRKASRTFRSWFSAPSNRRVDMEVNSKEDGARRVSLGGVVTPLFPGESLEARTRHLGDLYMLAGRYGEAAETYRLLQGDLRAMVGAALVHDGAAQEMGALATALVDGNKQAVGSAIEKSIQLYSRSGRRELAVRATLRGVEFCVEAGYPDSAAGVIIRAIEAILPKGVPFGSGLSSSGAAFVETALAVLYTSCSESYVLLGRKRRASLYAFLAATRFSKMKFHAAAACIAMGVDDTALLRKGVKDDVELILGVAENSEARHARAAAHFVRVLADADERTDAEVQGAAIQGFLDAASKGARDEMIKRWDSGVMFPPVDKRLARVSTYDSSDGRNPLWTGLEDDVLEDHEFFTALSETSTGGSLPKREQRVESVIAELRKKKERGDSVDPGGSLEMKIKRMRELAASKRKRRRCHSLLERGAIVGERIRLHVSLYNPLLFPVFVNSLSAVVSVDGQLYFSKSFQDGSGTVFDADYGDDGDDGDTEGEEMVEFIPMNSIILLPNSTQTVIAEVVSRKPCTLQFLGARWNVTIGMGGASPKASGSGPMVPGFCLLERRGRRLNETRKQRASDVPMYENDESMTVVVAPLEPRLKAFVRSPDCEFENRLDSLVLRAGETREATLSLKNEGLVPLNEIIVRNGTPKTLFANVAPDQVDADGEEIIFAIGLDDEVVTKPDELIAATRMSVNLKPKESTEITIWLRAAVPNAAFQSRAKMSKQGGRGDKRIHEAELDEEGMLPCHLRLVIAYGKSAVRVCRVGAHFRVQSSVLVSPRFLRPADADVLPGGNLHGLLLGLEVEHGGHNFSENLVFQVTEVSVTSRKGWRPVSLQQASQCEEDVQDEIEHSTTSLRVNETATVFFLVALEKQSTIPTESNELNSECESPWQTKTIDLSQTRPVLQPSEPPPLKETLEKSQPLTNGPGIQQKASTHFIVCANRGSNCSSTKARSNELVYISVGWRTSPKATGEMHIAPIDPLKWLDRAPALSLRGESPTAIAGQGKFTSSSGEDHQDWVSVKVKHPSTVYRTFFPSNVSSVSPLPQCIPVTISIRNTSAYLLNVVFATPSSGGIGDGSRGRYWAGDVGMSLRSLPPGAERILNLGIVVTGPGRFCVGDFMVAVQRGGYGEGDDVKRREIRVQGGEMMVIEGGKEEEGVAEVVGGIGDVDINGGDSAEVERNWEGDKSVRTIGQRTIELRKTESAGLGVEQGEKWKAAVKRARSEGGLGRIFKSSADDAFWDAEDTDESDGGR